MSRPSVLSSQVSFEVQPRFLSLIWVFADLEKYVYAFYPRYHESNIRLSVVFVFSSPQTTI